MLGHVRAQALAHRIHDNRHYHERHFFAINPWIVVGVDGKPYESGS